MDLMCFQCHVTCIEDMFNSGDKGDPEGMAFVSAGGTSILLAACPAVRLRVDLHGSRQAEAQAAIPQGEASQPVAHRFGYLCAH